MNLIMKYALCILLFVSFIFEGFGWKQSPAPSKSTTETEMEISWIDWFSDTFHRVMYVILVTAIITCAIYNYVKNKLENKVENSWPKNSLDIQSYSSSVLSFADINGSSTAIVGASEELEVGESENALKQRLKDTQDEIEMLKKQLTATMDDKAELESTLALLDKEKFSFELDVELSRVEERVELEKIRNENASVKKEIQKILEEKESAEREAERLQRDIDICRTATLDAHYLKDRVHSAKQEADILRKHFSNLRVEKGIKDLSPEMVFEDSQSLNVDQNELKSNFLWPDQDFQREYCVISSN